MHFATGGFRPPVVLLHGLPEAHLMRRHVAPRLARQFIVFAPAPTRLLQQRQTPGGMDRYSKRAMGELRIDRCDCAS